jgi:putative lipoprotein
MEIKMSLSRSALLAAALVLTSAAGAAAAEGPAGHWRALTIWGKSVAAKPASELDLSEKGNVTGTGGCNRLFGKAKISSSKIHFGPLGGAMMMCEPAVMKQEQKFHAALRDVRNWRIEGKKLVLESKTRKPILVLEPK